MTDVFSRALDPFKHARDGICLEGTIPLAKLPRVAAELLEPMGDAFAKLQFAVDQDGKAYIEGRVKASLALTCQRCLQPFDWSVDSVFKVSPVKNTEEAEKLPAPYEPVMLQEGYVDLRRLIEDEIVLNLPMVAHHEPEECAVQMGDYEERKPKPFAALASLKKKITD